MNIYKFPDKKEWHKLTKRPVFEKNNLRNIISEVFENVKINGDEALKFYTQKFDGVELENLAISEKEISEAENLLNI